MCRSRRHAHRLRAVVTAALVAAVTAALPAAADDDAPAGAGAAEWFRPLSPVAGAPATAAGPTSYPVDLHWARSALRPGEVATSEVTLPPDATQGPGRWWMVQLPVRVVARPSARPAQSLLSVDTNGRTAGQLTVSARRHHGRAEYAYETASMVGGTRRSVAAARERVVYVENYLQDRGVQGGRNVVAVKLEDVTRSAVARVDLLPGARLLGTPISPYEITLRHAGTTVRATPGKTVTLPVGVERRGGRPDAPLRVIVEYDRTLLQPIGPDTVEVDSVGAGRVVQFRFRAMRLGRAPVLVRVRSQYNRVGLPMTVDVVAVKRGDLAARGMLPLAVVLGAVAIVSAVRMRQP